LAATFRKIDNYFEFIGRFNSEACGEGEWWEGSNGKEKMRKSVPAQVPRSRGAKSPAAPQARAAWFRRPDSVPFRRRALSNHSRPNGLARRNCFYLFEDREPGDDARGNTTWRSRPTNPARKARRPAEARPKAAARKAPQTPAISSRFDRCSYCAAELEYARSPPWYNSKSFQGAFRAT